jgi:hypothetical protein
VIAVVTCERPCGASYLRATLDSIDASARDTNKLVFVDGAEPLPLPDGWRSVCMRRPGERAENRWTAWGAIRVAAAGDEDLLLCEDDIRFCRNGAARAETVPIPDDVAFLSYFAPFGDMTMVEGIWRTGMTTFGYAQCLRLPARTCRELADADQEMRDCPVGMTDAVLRAIGVRRRWRYGVHYPGIVQHVGEVSAIGTGSLDGCRVSRAYPGDEYDAHSLWLPHYA